MRDRLLGIVNVGFTIGVFFVKPEGLAVAPLAACLTLVGASFVTMRFVNADSTARYATAVLVPVAFLVATKLGYLPPFVGVSYLAFRLAYLAYELHSERVTDKPPIDRYLGFAFLPLTFLIGPISPYGLYQKSSDAPQRRPIWRSALRIALGAAKCFVIAEACRRFAFEQFWFRQGHQAFGWFWVAGAASYLNLYFNFSGATDMIIGGGWLLELELKENFDNPLAARNIREFWSRFHISLTDFMRDIVFTPGNLYLSRLFGKRGVWAATSFMLMVNFILVGLWHGVTKSFFALGLLHGAAMTTFFLFSLALKKLPKPTQKTIQTSPVVRAISTSITFAFLSATSLLFENDWSHVRAIVGVLIPPLLPR